MSGRGPGSPTPGPPVTRAGPAGAKHRGSRGIAKRMEKKRRETGTRESERLILPAKPGNLTRRDPAEGRGRRVAESLEGNMAGASKPGTVFTKQQRIAELAKQSPSMAFTSLNHHLDLVWLLEPCQVRPVPSAARTAGAYPEGHGNRNPALGDSHAGRQNPSASGRHGVGADLRAGLSGLFARFQAGAIGAPCAARFVEANYGLGWLLVGGSGHPEVLRHAGSWSSASIASAAGT